MPIRAKKCLKGRATYGTCWESQFLPSAGLQKKIPCMVTVRGQPLWGLQRFPRFHLKENGQNIFCYKIHFPKKKMTFFSARWGWSLYLCFVTHFEWLLISLPQKFQQNKEPSYLTAVHQGLSKYQTAQDTRIRPTSIKHSRILLSHSNLPSL